MTLNSRVSAEQRKVIKLIIPVRQRVSFHVVSLVCQCHVCNWPGQNAMIHLQNWLIVFASLSYCHPQILWLLLLGLHGDIEVSIGNIYPYASSASSSPFRFFRFLNFLPPFSDALIFYGIKRGKSVSLFPGHERWQERYSAPSLLLWLHLSSFLERK